MTTAGRSLPPSGPRRRRPHRPGPPTGPLPPTGLVSSHGTTPPARPELSDAALVSRSWGMAFATLV
ncbi:MAG: hypothetical protein WCF69_30720, partial [Mycobacterium sp.]